MKTILYTTLAALTLSNLSAEIDYPSLASKVLTEYSPGKVTDRSPEAQTKAAQLFLKSLSATEVKKAKLSFDSKEKEQWTNFPPRGFQAGVRLGDLQPQQIRLAMNLLATVLSEQGFAKARNIPLADDRLLTNGRRIPGYGAEDFSLVLFGEPSATEPWALQLDGHHLAINLTIKGEKMSLSPSFIGTQPKQFHIGKKVITPIIGRTTKAHALVQALPENLQKIAIISNKRGRIKAGAGKDGYIPKITGLSCSKLNQDQQNLLLDLLKEYVSDLPQHAAKPRLKELKKEIPQMHFSWYGPTAKNSDISYRIQGPSLIIEYACQDYGGRPLNHLHAIYRDPTNEYGKKILAK